jgi:hypothetical protein
MFLGAVVCLVGLSPAGRILTVDVRSITGDTVLQNSVVLGSVSASRGHYGRRPMPWPRLTWAGWMGLVSRRAPERHEEVLEKQPHEARVVDRAQRGRLGLNGPPRGSASTGGESQAVGSVAPAA